MAWYSTQLFRLTADWPVLIPSSIFIMLSTNQKRSCLLFFKVFVMTRPGIEPANPNHKRLYLLVICRATLSMPPSAKSLGELIIFGKIVLKRDLIWNLIPHVNGYNWVDYFTRETIVWLPVCFHERQYASKEWSTRDPIVCWYWTCLGKCSHFAKRFTIQNNSFSR